MDELSALKLQVEWGADEALGDDPVDRLLPRPAPTMRAHAAPPSSLPSRAAQVVAAADLASLHAALDGFNGCPLRATATTTVAPSGNPAAGLVLIGEAPGPDDDRSGQAFSGALGATLERVLASAGLDRTTLLLGFLVPWRPPGGRPLNESEVAACLPFLHRLLALTNPRRVVLMGNWPLRALAGEAAGYRAVRGRWLDVTVQGLEAPLPALPMLSPDQWLKTATSRQNTWSDLLTLREVLEAAL